MPAFYKTRFFLFAFSAVFFVISGCGGGGGEGGTTPLPGGGGLAPKILQWIPPSSYSDGSALDPIRDLNDFEIYVNSTGVFTNADTPMAFVSAVDSATGQVSTTFNLSNLAPYLSPGVTYYVALRAEALTGLKSDFSQGATFSF